MKITCQECQSNFSVADEKVAGTVVKIRCKKCGATMVVNGKDGTTTTERKSLPDDAPALSGSDVTEAASSEESEPRAALREGGRDKSKDLFGDAASAGSEGDGGKTEAKLTGGRNESSVLFSLKSLTKEGDAAPAKAAEESKTTASGDGSGLIDIRALAGKKSDDKPSAAVDDILSLGGGGAFGPSLTAPNLAAAPVVETTPSEAPKEKSNRGIIFAIIGSAVFLGVVIVIAVVATRPSGDTTRPDPVTTTSASPAPQTSAETPKVAQTAPTPTETTTAKPPGELPTSIPSSGHGAVAAAPKASSKTEPTTQPVAAATTPTVTKPLSLEEELRKKAGQPTTAPTKPAETGGGGSFDRAAAGISLGGINIAGCKKPDGPTGSGHVTVTFDPSGSVQSAIIDGGPFPGTPVGGCIAGKYRGAHVPAFSGSPVKVGKSFTL